MRGEGGFSLAELAVALALLAILVLGGATLLFSLSHSAREGQNRSLLQADLQEVRSRLAQDVIQSSGFSCAANGQSANLDLSGHSVIYSLSQGKVWRNNQALTLQGEYEGTFACNDPLLGLKLSYRGEVVGYVEVSRRVGALAASPLQQPLTLVTSTARTTGNGERILDLQVHNGQTSTLWIYRVDIAAPTDTRLTRFRLSGGNDWSGSAFPPVIYTTPPLRLDPGANLAIQHFWWSTDIRGKAVALQVYACRTDNSSCPLDQQVTAHLRFSCSTSSCAPL